ncbi:MAG: DUF58 domain-containing protein [Planctomycetes bacterium]|nr:DUF58 domain-containing protein [Planctomycetota bacterium]
MDSRKSGSTTERPPLLDDGFLAKIQRLSLVSRKTVSGSVRGERRSRRRGFSTEFADYRDYVAGDDLRYLDWNIYGRLDRLFVKLFHEEEDLTVSILVDVSKSMATGRPEKLFYALQVAAALSYIGLVAEDRVGVYPFSNELHAPFRPVRGKRNAPRLFRFLQSVPVGQHTDLERSLRAFAHAFVRRGLVILISDLLDPSGFEGPLRHITARSVETHLIHVLSPEEVDPELVGDLRLVDCEDDSIVEVSLNRRLLEAYRESVAGFRSAVQHRASQRGVSPLFATTDVPFDHLVLGYLRKRGLLG